MAKDETTEVEAISTAIVIADSFDRRFTPITLETPRALIPLLNIPTINYTLELLVSSGMTKIYILVRSHAQMIEDYVMNSWVGVLEDVDVEFVVSQKATSLGDALREIHERFEDEIKSDFLLLQGDVVSNMKLGDVLRKHQILRKKNRQAIMTSLFKKASPFHRTRAGEDATIVAIDSDSKKLLHFDNSTNPTLHVDIGLFKDHPAVEFRYDLIDCNIDICSPEVLFLFQDNFDYKDLRKDFMNGVLGSELLGYDLYTHVIEQEYAARVRGLNTYAAVSRDIAHRWAYPMVPDSNLTGTTSFKYNYRGDFYQETGVILSRSCEVSRSSVIGENTSIGENSELLQCVVGRNCVIGDNVKLAHCYIWDNVTVEDNCTVTNSILCSNVRLLPRTLVQEGCVLSFGVTVGPDITLVPETKLTLIDHFSDEEENDIYTNNDEEVALEPFNAGKGEGVMLWLYDEGEETNTLRKLVDAADRFVVVKQPSNAELEVPGEEEQATDGMDEFQRDIYEIIYNGFLNNVEVSLISIEVKSRCLAHHRPFVDGAIGFLSPVLDLIRTEYSTPATNAKAFVGQFQPLVSKWKDLFQEFITNEADEVDFLYSLCATLISQPDDVKPAYIGHLLMMLDTFYENECLKEDAIIKWADELAKSTDEDDKQLLAGCKSFVEWLKEADEEDESEEESEEEEED